MAVLIDESEIFMIMILPNEIPRELDLKPTTYLDHFAKPDDYGSLMRRPEDIDVQNDMPFSEI